MTRNKAKHIRERKRRHKRQIEEGTRDPPSKEQKKRMERVRGIYYTGVRRKVKLSEIDRKIVQAVIDAVRKLDLD